MRPVVAVALLVAVACGHAPGIRAEATVASGPLRYEQAVDAAAARGLRVWLEVDLVKRWLGGRASFDAAIVRLGALASRRGVAGVKIADELAYDGALASDPQRVSAFLRDAARALRRAAPQKAILVDITLPELGCLASVAPATACRRSAREKYPALRLENVDGIVASGDVDVLDVATSLLSPATYERWGITDAIAQHAAWAEIARRGWGKRVKVNGRKALAHTGRYGASRAGADHDVAVFVDEPLAAGAQAVDIWTWRQPYKGGVMRLMNPGNESNVLWRALRQRRTSGAKLFTHFTPSSLEVGLNEDLGHVAECFTDVFVAAGLG